MTETEIDSSNGAFTIDQAVTIGDGQLTLSGSFDLFALTAKQREVFLHLMDTFALMHAPRSRRRTTENQETP